MSRRVSISLIVLVSMAIVAGVFLWQYERREIELDIPMRGEARFNHFLAAERLLAAVGIASDSLSEFAPRSWLPRSDETLVIDFNYRTLDQEQIDLLLNWVSDGGHLVLEAAWSSDDAWDPILGALEVNVERFGYDDDSAGDESDAAAVATDWGRLDGDNGRVLNVPAERTIYRVHDERGVFAAQFPFGAGFLTVAADLSFATNRRIGKANNARILTRLLTHTIPPGKAWFVYARDFPSLLSLIWRHGGHLVIASGLFLALFLWRVSQRFGPPIPVAAPARKSFLEHVDAAGAFLWQNHAEGKLLDDAQIAFTRALERKNPQLRHAPQTERVVYLADVSGIPRADVRAALTPLDHRNRHEFTLRIKTLQTLWTKI